MKTCKAPVSSSNGGSHKTSGLAPTATQRSIPVVRAAIALAMLAVWASFALAQGQSAANFHIIVERIPYMDAEDPSLVTGRIYVNGTPVGNTYENCFYAMPLGSYSGRMRYVSGKGFVLGGDLGDPSRRGINQLKHQGDFLMEIDVPGHDAVLFHPGNRSFHTCGCVALGPAVKGKVAVTDALMVMRRTFYGTDVPTETPDKNIQIDITGYEPKCKRGTHMVVLQPPPATISPGGTVECAFGLAVANDCHWLPISMGEPMKAQVSVRYRMKWRGNPTDFQPPQGDKVVGYIFGGHTGIQTYQLQRDMEVDFSGDRKYGTPGVRDGGWYSQGHQVSISLPSCSYGDVKFRAQYLGSPELGASNAALAVSKVSGQSTACEK